MRSKNEAKSRIPHLAMVLVVDLAHFAHGGNKSGIAVVTDAHPERLVQVPRYLRKKDEHLLYPIELAMVTQTLLVRRPKDNDRLLVRDDTRKELVVLLGLFPHPNGIESGLLGPSDLFQELWKCEIGKCLAPKEDACALF